MVAEVGFVWRAVDVCSVDGRAGKGEEVGYMMTVIEGNCGQTVKLNITDYMLKWLFDTGMYFLITSNVVHFIGNTYQCCPFHR